MLKKLLLILIGLIFITGCAGIQMPKTVYNQPCNIYAEVGATPENSLIASKIENPCLVHKILVTAAKLPVIWGEKEYLDAFNEWSGKVEAIIESGITYKYLQDLIIIEVAKFNREAGMALLIIGDGIFIFDDQEVIMPVDKKLLLMSLEDLRAKVARMSILAG